MAAQSQRGSDRRLVRHSVDWTIEEMIATYPMLFHSRTLALHHLFVVLGCGYEWQDGKLVAKFEEPVEDRIPRTAARILASYKTKIEHPYPYCDMCNLAELPADADDDWKAAAAEARRDMENAKNQPGAGT